MKKLIALLLALMMVMALVACGDDAAKPADAPDAEGTDEVVEEEVEDPIADIGEDEPPIEKPEEEEETEAETETEVEVVAPFDTALATDAVGFIYTPDFASLLLMVHPSLLEEAGEEMLISLAEEGNAQMQAYLDAFAAEVGETSLAVEAGEVVACTEEELAGYAEMYEGYDVTVNAAVQVPVIVTNAADGSIIGEHVMYFIEIDGAWYLDINSAM